MPHKEAETEPVHLPLEKETLAQRVQRSLQPSGDVDIVTEASDRSEVSSIRKVFSQWDLENLKGTFADMIEKSHPISKVKVTDVLTKESWGKEILKCYYDEICIFPI